MKDLTSWNFGIVIAFWLPGFLLLWLLSHSFAEIEPWFSSNQSADPSVGNFLFITLGSLSLGMIISAVRWIVVDSFLHHIVKLDRPEFDFGKLSTHDKYNVFLGLVENHYMYYQYYSNTFVAGVLGIGTYLLYGYGHIDVLGYVAIAALLLSLLLAAIDALSKYYKRVEQLQDK